MLVCDVNAHEASHSDTDQVSGLRCAPCGAPVPLADADTVQCPHCGATVAIPEAHRALRAAEREYNQHRDAAHALLARLGKAPSWFVRFLVYMNGLTVVALVTLGTLLSALLYIALMTLAVRVSLAVFHVDLDDVVLHRFDPNALAVLGQFACLLAFLGSLIVAGAYVRTRGKGLREVQAELSAKPPERPKGPSRCRACGAPLSSNPNDLAVTCPYCRSDNLLKIPERWTRDVINRGQRLVSAVEDAALSFQEEERAIRRSLIVRLTLVLGAAASILVVLFGLTGGAEREFTTETPYHRIQGDLFTFDWNASVASPGLTLDHEDARGCLGGRCFVSLRRGSCPERDKYNQFVVPAGACDAQACMVHWYVALRRGDTIEFAAHDVPAQSFVTLQAHVRNAPFHRNAATWGRTLPGYFAWLSDGTRARLPPAPHDGWFQLLLGLGEGATGWVLPICARISRRER